MEPIKTISGTAISLPHSDIDTDQIIPARFLKVTGKSGLGKKLFFDWRFESNGTEKPDFVLNRPDSRSAQVLVAGDNFGCGSSREHAPWALVDWGIKAVVATSFADIFRANALKNGLIVIELPKDAVDSLHSAAPTQVSVDLANASINFADNTWSFPIDEFSKQCILKGKSELDYLLSKNSLIQRFEDKR